MTPIDNSPCQSYLEYVSNLARIDSGYRNLEAFFREPIVYEQDRGSIRVNNIDDIQPCGGVTVVNFFSKHLELRQSSFHRGCTDLERAEITHWLDESHTDCKVRLVFVDYRRNWNIGGYQSVDRDILDHICWRYRIHPEIVQLHFSSDYGLDKYHRPDIYDGELELSPIARTRCTFLRYKHGFLTATQSRSHKNDGVTTVVLARDESCNGVGLFSRVFSLHSTFPDAKWATDCRDLGTNQMFLRHLNTISEQEIMYISENPGHCLTIYGLIALQTEHFWLRFWRGKVGSGKLDINLTTRYVEQKDQVLQIKSNAINMKKIWAGRSLDLPPSYTTLLEATETLINDANDQLEQLQLLMTYRASIASLQESQMSVRQAQQSIKQNQRVKLLTQLAFIFIPLSAISSLFGMNVVELDLGPARIWMFVVAVVLAYVLGLLFWALMSSGLLQANWTRLSSLKERRRDRGSIVSSRGRV